MNPKFVIGIIQALLPFAIVGGTGYAIYKGIDNILESITEGQNTNLGIRNLGEKEYKYAQAFLQLFTAESWDFSKQKIIDLVNQANDEGVNWQKVAYFYKKIAKGKEFKGDCAMFICSRHYDSSGNFLSHLRIALDERFNEVIDKVG